MRHIHNYACPTVLYNLNRDGRNFLSPRKASGWQVAARALVLALLRRFRPEADF